MIDEHDNLVPKEICDREHEFIDKTLVDLKANIHTSKESLGNRLDTVDAELQKALLGETGSPGGLLNDVASIKKDKEEYEETMNKDFKVLEDKIAKDVKILYRCMWGIMGLIALLIGGRFIGLEIKSIKEYINPTPVVAPVPIIEDSENVPSELKILIQELIKNQEDRLRKLSDVPKDKDVEKYENGHKNTPIITVNKITSSPEESE